MKRLKVIDMGTKVQGVKLKGDIRDPEPTYFRVVFPGGDVDIVRCDDDSYWIHVRVDNHPDISEIQDQGKKTGFVMDGRQDVTGKHACDCHAGELDNPDLEHLAVRVGIKGKHKQRAS